MKLNLKVNNLEILTSHICYEGKIIDNCAGVHITVMVPIHNFDNYNKIEAEHGYTFV